MQRNIHRWMVLCCAFLTMFLGSSLFSATGVIHIALIDRFEESVAKTAWAGAIFGGFFCLSAPLAGILINSYSCRTCIITGGVLNLLGFASSSFSPNLQILYFTYGFIGGTAQALCYTGSYVASGFYFEKQQSLAVGFTISGFALGMIVFPALAQYILNVYGLTGTFLLLGAMGFQVCVFGALVRPHRLELELQITMKNENPGWNLRCIFNSVFQHLEILKNISFLIFCLSIIFWSESLALISLFLPDYYRESGSSLTEAALLTSIVGIGSIFSRILTGFASLEDGIDSRLLYFGSYVVIGTVTVTLYAYGYSFWGKVIYSLLFGLYTGGSWTLLGPITVSILGISKFATGLSLGMFFIGIGCFTGPLIGGYIYGNQHSYSSVFIYSGVMHYMSALCGLIMTLTMQNEGYKGRHNKSDELAASSKFLEEQIINTNCNDQSIAVAPFEQLKLTTSEEEAVETNAFL